MEGRIDDMNRNEVMLAGPVESDALYVTQICDGVCRSV
jgi:hypothetical protein